jgi:hypothetical protein
MLVSELEHAGVKGMKWGVRKADRVASSDHTEARSLKKKKVSELSNTELRKLNDRKQLEKKYKDLNPNVIQAGHKKVAAIIALGGLAATAVALSKGPVGQLGKEAIAKAVKASMSNAGKHVLVEATKATARHL